MTSDEMDALVSEKVMGRCPHPMDDLEYWYDEEGEDGGFRCKRCGKEDIYGDHCLPYSTDMGAAWDVIEEIKKRGFSYRLFDLGDKHWCTFTNRDGLMKECAWSENPAEAVCLAALAIVGVEL